MFIWTIRTILVFGKKVILICKFPSSFHFLGKSHFLRLLWKWIYFVEVSSQKVPLLGCSRRGFYFWKINISEILRHAHFEEIAFLLIFGQNIDLIWSEYQPNIPDSCPRGTRDHLRPKRSILYCNLQHIWKKRPFRCRVAKVTCTKYVK